ncbi:MAG: segregation/condensation protein A [DPANN group archaeon]|nr:segregation/condensation protein A [DPANN group archaeon]
MSKEIYDMILQGDDVKWQAIIYDLVRAGKIDPWDLDVSVLAREYLRVLRELKQHNFRLSGKVVLAAAILLKMKTERLGVEQLLALTNPDECGDDLHENETDLVDLEEEKHFKKASLAARIPGVRKRKVTVFELMDALKKALEVDQRREQKQIDMAELRKPREITIKKVDIFAKIELLWAKIKSFVHRFKKNSVTFSEILPSKEKKDIIWTLLPLLHLAQHQKVELRQEEAFKEIFIDLHDGLGDAAIKKEEFAEPEEIIEPEKEHAKPARKQNGRRLQRKKSASSGTILSHPAR